MYIRMCPSFHCCGCSGTGPKAARYTHTAQQAVVEHPAAEPAMGCARWWRRRARCMQCAATLVLAVLAVLVVAGTLEAVGASAKTDAGLAGDGDGRATCSQHKAAQASSRRLQLTCYTHSTGPVQVGSEQAAFALALQAMARLLAGPGLASSASVLGHLPGGTVRNSVVAGPNKWPIA